jgi:hypothetical protein
LVRPAVPARECFWSRACQEVAKKSLSGAGRFASGNGDFTADVMVDIAPANPTVFASFKSEHSAIDESNADYKIGLVRHQAFG